MSESDRATIKEALLDDLAQYNNVSGACKRTGIDTSTFYAWRADGFISQDELESAYNAFLDLIRNEIAERSLHGMEKLLVSQGRVIKDDNGKPLYQKFKDTRLLERVADKVLPEFQVSEKVDITTHDADGGVIDEVPKRYAIVIDVRDLTDEEIMILRKIGQDIEYRQKLLTNGHVVDAP